MFVYFNDKAETPSNIQNSLHGTQPQYNQFTPEIIYI